MHCYAKLMGNWLNSVIYAQSTLLRPAQNGSLDQTMV